MEVSKAYTELLKKGVSDQHPLLLRNKLGNGPVNFRVAIIFIPQTTKRKAVFIML